MQSIRLYLEKHEQGDRLFLDFPFDPKINSILKQIPGSRWSQRKKRWHLSAGNQTYLALREKTKGLAIIDDTELRRQLKAKFEANNKARGLSGETLQQVEAFMRWMQQKRYSNETIRNYQNHLVQFLSFCLPTRWNNLTVSDVERFNHEIVIGHNLSISYQNGIVNAIKLFYQQCADYKMDIQKLQRPFKESRLPEVLSKDEVKRVISAAGNIKHKALLSIIYSCGMRIGEVINLRIKDLDKERKLIRIVKAKGKKDRYAPYSDKLRELLGKYYNEWKPREYLFEGQYGGKYSERSAAKVLQQSLAKCRIKKKVTLHTLRHSFATHLLESGTDIRYIQELLGHNSPNTTMIYTHVSSKKISEIKSPFDDLDL